MSRIVEIKLKEKIPQRVYNLITVVGGYMFNRYVALLPLSVAAPITMIARIFNGIKYYCKFNLDGRFSWEYVITLLLTAISVSVLTGVIYCLLTLLIKYFTKIRKEIFVFYTMKYREVYYPTPQNNSLIVENTGLISYSQSISLIKESFYGLKAKLNAIKAGKLKESGGVFVTKQFYFRQFFSGEKYEEYLPSTQDIIESQKELQLYDLIFQEFSSTYGYIDSNNQCNHNSLYIKDIIKAEANKLKQFLRHKELELQ